MRLFDTDKSTVKEVSRRTSDEVGLQIEHFQSVVDLEREKDGFNHGRGEICGSHVELPQLGILSKGREESGYYLSTHRLYIVQVKPCQ